MIICGDCLEVMRGMEPNSIDAIVTDPPYGLEFMGKEWDKLWRNQTDADKAYVERTTRDGDGLTSRRRNLPDLRSTGTEMQDWHYAWAVEALRVAKPGAHLLAFGGTRTFHRLDCAIEDAGWEIRDCLMWVHGQGFPKSESVSLAIDKKACRLELEKALGRKPTKYEWDTAWKGYRELIGRYIVPADSDAGNRGKVIRRPTANISNFAPGSLPDGTPITAPATDSARQWEGWGTSLKPAWEPIILARKPLEGTVAQNVQKWGTGALNIDGCRVPMAGKKGYWPGEDYGDHSGVATGFHRGKGQENSKGRWPANLLHDGSEEVMELFPQTGPPCGSPKKHDSKKGGVTFGLSLRARAGSNAAFVGDSGSAARFFYTAKASRAEREAGLEGMEEGDRVFMGSSGRTLVNGEWVETHSIPRKTKNHHPTVKPLALMRYLCRLVTPPNGLILDPFMGSGTTLIAAEREGFRAVGIELNKDYCEIAEKRTEYIEHQMGAQL